MLGNELLHSCSYHLTSQLARILLSFFRGTKVAKPLHCRTNKQRLFDLTIKSESLIIFIMSCSTPVTSKYLLSWFPVPFILSLLRWIGRSTHTPKAEFMTRQTAVSSGWPSLYPETKMELHGHDRTRYWSSRDTGHRSTDVGDRSRLPYRRYAKILEEKGKILEEDHDNESNCD